MTLLVACLLIFQFDLPWVLYPVAAAVWAAEKLLVALLNARLVFTSRKTLAVAEDVRAAIGGDTHKVHFVERHRL